MQNLARAEDAAVVAQVLAGDREAYRLLVERHSRAIFRVAFRVLRSEEDAEEVVQETFLRAYRNLERFEQRANFGTWLYRIAMNCALDLKDKPRPVATVQIAEEPDPEANEMQVASREPSADRTVYGEQVRRRIAQAMERLSETERAAFTLRHLEGRSIEEIAGVLGIKANAAKNSIFRAVQKMRDALGPVVATTR
jgi:RNA polymerase sigma-70 factor (ECF subfamily)